MDFIDQLRQFSARAEKLRPQLQTEEATKTSLIMPFFQLLGYDVFNPEEFTPEFTADIGTKKHEKVDYAVWINGEPSIIVEAKWCGVNLDDHVSQILRYFGVTKAKFGILTNGIKYRFFTDLDKANVMDDKHFLELDITNIREAVVPEVKRFCKANFNIKEIYDRASELKYSSEIKAYFTSQLKEPESDFVKLMISKTYTGTKTAYIIEKFTPTVKNALNSLINEMMNERITAALKNENQVDEQPATTVDEISAESQSQVSGVVTTEEELQAFYIVKGILAETVDLSTISYKDTTGYFAVIYNNQAWNWICRFKLGMYNKQILFPSDPGKNVPGRETRNKIEDLDEIYKYRDEIITTAKAIMGGTPEGSAA